MSKDGPEIEAHSVRPLIRAAQYVRMSTEHQKYSTENQADVIANYAAARGFEIVRTYADEGKSGLNLSGREALQALIADVTTGNADYAAILAYDVSRWGRFQDADMGAHYEYLCRSAGVAVHYCAEQFENDGSIGSTIIKTVKRAMAGEYSRELSAKVFNGQCRLIRYGFRQGGPAGYGLRRVLVDEHRIFKAELTRGEHKSIQTDRVVLQPGPADEIEVVRRIYRLFTLQGLKEWTIAEQLNREGLKSDLGRPWTRGTVHQILSNEKYIGNNVYNRISPIRPIGGSAPTAPLNPSSTRISSKRRSGSSMSVAAATATRSCWNSCRISTRRKDGSPA
jgi:DNA invertase Pin-like site-specific DNA recombinase